MPTWLHFGSIFQVLGHLGGILGRLGGVLGRLGALLGASWRILARLGASWGVLEPSWRRFGPQEKPVLIRNGKRRFVLNSCVWLHFGGILTILPQHKWNFLGRLCLQKPSGTTLDLKASSSSRTLRLLRSLRSPYLCLLGFRWDYAVVAQGFRLDFAEVSLA